MKTRDVVKINGIILKKTDKIKVWKMYKPVKYICSTKDRLNRKKIFELLPKGIPNLICVGRLDYMSEGLILFTNSGDYSRLLELPSSNLERTYRVCVSGIVKNSYLKQINRGIKIKEVEYNKVKLDIEKKSKDYVWLIFKLKEGKNREIRNICNFFSWKVIKLLRIGYGPYKLGKLRAGEFIKTRLIKND